MDITTIDDLALIQAFVQSLIQGEEILLANRNLKAETLHRTNQLSAKQEGMIAVAKLADRCSYILVRQESLYWRLIHQTLLSQNLFPIAEAGRDGFYRYQRLLVPQGYRVNWTAAQDLWRLWWRYRRHHHALEPLELLLLNRGAWSSVRDICCAHGLLQIKTDHGKVSLPGSQMAIWLWNANSASAANAV